MTVTLALDVYGTLIDTHGVVSSLEDTVGASGGRGHLRRHTGSVTGAGGLRARLLHHLRPGERPRWHIDDRRE
jgi:hypothetical protein